MSIKGSFSLLSLLILVACSGDGTQGVGQPSSNAVVYNGSSYPVAQGLADAYGETATHYNVDFGFTDGYFSPYTDYTDSVPVTTWINNSVRTELDLELYSPGTDGFRTGTFAYTPLSIDETDDPSLVGAYFFNEAYVGFDTNGDNEVLEAEEVDVTGGTVTVSGTAPNYQVTFNLQLANGLTVTGSFAEEFIVD